MVLQLVGVLADSQESSRSLNCGIAPPQYCFCGVSGRVFTLLLYMQQLELNPKPKTLNKPEVWVVFRGAAVSAPGAVEHQALHIVIFADQRNDLVQGSPASNLPDHWRKLFESKSYGAASVKTAPSFLRRSRRHQIEQGHNAASLEQADSSVLRLMARSSP